MRVILDVRGATQDHNSRIGKAMRELGWEYKKASFDGKKLWAYVKRTSTADDARQIHVIRDKDGLVVCYDFDAAQPAAAAPPAVAQSDWEARFGKGS